MKTKDEFGFWGEENKLNFKLEFNFLFNTCNFSYNVYSILNSRTLLKQG